MILLRLHFKRMLAVSISLCFVISQLAPSLAVACEGGGAAWLSVKNIGGVPERGRGLCQFTAVGQKCQLEFENITFRTLEVLEGKIENNGSGRYAKVKEGCTPKLALLNKENCVDEIQAAKLESPNINDYCMKVKDAGTGEIQNECTTQLQM
jgi:hypothetical protein